MTIEDKNKKCLRLIKITKTMLAKGKFKNRIGLDENIIDDPNNYFENFDASYIISVEKWITDGINVTYNQYKAIIRIYKGDQLSPE